MCTSVQNTPSTEHTQLCTRSMLSTARPDALMFLKCCRQCIKALKSVVHDDTHLCNDHVPREHAEQAGHRTGMSILSKSI